MNVPLVVVVMLFVSSAVAMVARRLRVPYTVALVVAGLALSLVRLRLLPDLDTGLHLTKELLFAVLLPALIYEAAFHLELREFFANWKGIVTMAVPGVAAGIFACGGLLYGGLQALALPVGFGAAVLVSTILAATDPVGVISLLRATRAPRRLAVVMEGESLLNDGVAVVAFAVVLVAMGLNAEQPAITAGWLARFVTWELGGALLLGGGIGLLLSWLTSQVDDHLIEITLTTIAAYGSFLLAEQAHASGVIACLVAGMMTGNLGAKRGMSPSTRVAVISFWEYAAFAANSIVFLLIGLDVDPTRLLGGWKAVVVTWLAMLLSRAAFVALAMPQLARIEGAMPRGFALVLIWGGVRGGIAMVLALSIPRAFEHRELAVTCIFGAALLTVLVQATTMGRLLRALGLARDRRGFEHVERLRGQRRSLHATLSHLDRQMQIGAVPEAIGAELREELVAESRALEAEWGRAQEMAAHVRREERMAVQRQLLVVRKEALRRAAADGAIDEVVMRQLLGELDDQLHALELAEAEESGAPADDLPVNDPE